jgi:hypothetical protein
MRVANEPMKGFDFPIGVINCLMNGVNYLMRVINNLIKIIKNLMRAINYPLKDWNYLSYVRSFDFLVLSDPQT